MGFARKAFIPNHEIIKPIRVKEIKMLKDLTECRRQIDELDSQILPLLEKRMNIALDVARYKIANGIKVFDEERERAVLNRIGERASEEFRANIVGAYDALMCMSKLSQYELKSETSPNRESLKEAIERGDNDKLIFGFNISHKSGALVRILSMFSALGLNLTKIESKPIENNPSEYRIYIELDGSMRDARVFNLICALSDELSDFRLNCNSIEG